VTNERVLVTDTGESVDAYIAECPPEVQRKLMQVRAAIRAVAPGAIETTSYFAMPGYSYPGYDYNGMFVWFSFKKPNVRLHLRPPTIEEHAKELVAYSTSKSIVSFPADRSISSSLVKTLVRASLDAMRARTAGLRPGF
jgi:uncharacterized protein YdhG (YjbR/CyaY superfamily)